MRAPFSSEQTGSSIPAEDIAVDWVLLAIGTVGGLLTAALVAVSGTFTRHENKPDFRASAGWLDAARPPPWVAASTGALFAAYTPAGQARETLLWACYGFFGLSLYHSPRWWSYHDRDWNRLAQHKIGTPRWARWSQPLDRSRPVGQSNHRREPPRNERLHRRRREHERALRPTHRRFRIRFRDALVFALLWTVNCRPCHHHPHARAAPPVHLTWWSFTFPVGTCVTGLNGLALHSGSPLLGPLAVILLRRPGRGMDYTVAVRTFHGSVIRGTLLAPPRPA